MIAITGGSGEIAQQVALDLSKTQEQFRIYSRSKEKHSFAAENTIQVDSYDEIAFDDRMDTLLVTNGSFIFKRFEELSEDEINTQLVSNLESVVKIVWNFLRATNQSQSRDIYVVGSTAAYDLGAKAALYGACKLALKGFLQALNREYAHTDTRFTYISFSTVDNSMGKLVPDQISSTLLNIEEVSEEITLRILRRRNYYEPEVILRRRFIQEHKN